METMQLLQLAGRKRQKTTCSGRAPCRAFYETTNFRIGDHRVALCFQITIILTLDNHSTEY